MDWLSSSRLLGGIIVTAGLIACSGENNMPKQAPLTVSTKQVQYQRIPIIKQYIGITKSMQAVDIRARVEGFLIKKNFTEGKLVNKDQLLYVIDPRPYKAKLDHYEAVLKSNIAERDYQALEFVRFKKLVSQGNVAKVRFDNVKAKLKEAQASVALAKADVEQAKLNLDYCYMKSPLTGRIGEKLVDVGNYVGGADKTVLAKVVQLNPIYVEFNPSVSDYAEFINYRHNKTFAVTVTMPPDNTTSFKGKVDMINNQANVSTSTIEMRAIIDNPDKLLLPGIYVNVDLILDNDSKQLLIPSEAVSDVQGQRSLFILGKDNKVIVRKITTSGEYKGQTIIKSGLKAGETIILDNLQKLRPAMSVTPKQDSSAKKDSKNG